MWQAAGALVLAVTAAVGGAVGGIMAGSHAAPAAQIAAPTTTQPGAAYLAIAVAGNTSLDRDFDRLHGQDRGDLTAAAGDLRDIATTEHLFDERLAALTLPAGPEGWARTLIRVNETRAALTRQAAASSTLAELAGYQQRLTAANARVEQAVRAIRAELGLPAPDTD